jgi:hypothetical protein
LVLGEVGDRPLLTASEAFGLVDCAAFGATGAKDLCPGFGNVGDRGEVFEVVFPGSAVISCLGEETFLWVFGEVGAFIGGLLGVVGDLVET